MLPTGHGKSLIYYVLPYTGSNKAVIISSPLDAILLEQSEKLGDAALNMTPNFVHSLEKGKYHECRNSMEIEFSGVQWGCSFMF